MDSLAVFVTVSLLQLHEVISISPFKNSGFYESNHIPELPKDSITSYPVSPIPELMKYRPRKKDLRLKKLLRKLSPDFDADWMSIEVPVSLSADHVTLSNSVETSVDVKLMKAFTSLNLTFTNQQGLTVDVGNENLELFKQWLLRRGSCRVTYRWEDLGPLLWPRWLKKGSCTDTLSCSWPPGMHCMPRESKLIRILRWDCRKRRKHRKHKKRHRKHKEHPHHPPQKRKRRRRHKGMWCRWVKVSFPVTDKCFCSC